MADRITGRCKCGQVTYEGTRLDAASFRCHCRDCQQLTGTGHADMLPLSLEGFSVSDACKIFEMEGGSGQPTYSGFCPECGAQILRRSARMSDRVYVHAGSLDDPSAYAPDRSIYDGAAQPWDTGSIIDRS
ncbi:GFA family protein [Hasllibacter sp. MH4015]|uniref:GFA family protein n=1 Tax=Hasllibacter sp. MH4015 TaxID=2854029 RepID=UPI001CD7DD1C|nr:GFA family protein [Hasllibacter sp. MH4015]